MIKDFNDTKKFIRSVAVFQRAVSLDLLDENKWFKLRKRYEFEQSLKFK